MRKNPLCQKLEILWRTVPSGANGPGRREIHRGKCFETNTHDAANCTLGILKETQKLISRHEHADAVRRLPSVRILKFFGGRLHWEQMDQGVARSTVENVLEQLNFSWDPKKITSELWFPLLHLTDRDHGRTPKTHKMKKWKKFPLLHLTGGDHGRSAGGSRDALPPMGPRGHSANLFSHSGQGTNPKLSDRLLGKPIN